MKTKENGLAAIAKSTRATKKASTMGAPTKALPGEEKPTLQLEGWAQKTSLALDAGLWMCVLDTAHLLSKRLRARGRRKVTQRTVMEAAFRVFHELPVEKQLELVSRQE